MSDQGPPRRRQPPPRPPGDYMPPQNPRRPDRGRSPPRPYAPSPSRRPSAPRPPTRRPRWPRWPGRSRRSRRPRWLRRALLLLVVLIVGSVGYIELALDRVDAVTGYPDRVADTSGTNWLIVGSDSREGLSGQQRDDLQTGDAAGQRTDTIILLHMSSSGEPATLVSLPRDSAVTVPGFGTNKINAAFAFGGAPLLTRTVESATGIRIDHYAQLGFGGFAGVVDAVGGIEVCLDQPLDDPKAGIDLSAGCQDLSGTQALGYVRSRATARGDLDRVQRQREFLGALADRVASPAVLLNPLRVVPLVARAADTLTVDNGDHVWHLARLGWTMRGASGGDLVTTTVPIAGFGQLAGGGSTVEWGAQADELFDALAEDEPVPPELVTE